MSLTNVIIESTATISGYGGVFTGSNIVFIILGSVAIIATAIYKIAKLHHERYMFKMQSPHFCKSCNMWMKPQFGIIPYTNIHRQYFECPKCGKISK
jgi:predicted RNA-binding Zn-ribbon protein involved in translation (DUF1610 family)